MVDRAGQFGGRWLLLAAGAWVSVSGLWAAAWGQPTDEAAALRQRQAMIARVRREIAQYQEQVAQLRNVLPEAQRRFDAADAAYKEAQAEEDRAREAAAGAKARMDEARENLRLVIATQQKQFEKSAAYLEAEAKVKLARQTLVDVKQRAVADLSAKNAEYRAAVEAVRQAQAEVERLKDAPGVTPKQRADAALKALEADSGVGKLQERLLADHEAYQIARKDTDAAVEQSNLLKKDFEDKAGQDPVRRAAEVRFEEIKREYLAFNQAHEKSKRNEDSKRAAQRLAGTDLLKVTNALATAEKQLEIRQRNLEFLIARR